MKNQKSHVIILTFIFLALCAVLALGEDGVDKCWNEGKKFFTPIFAQLSVWAKTRFVVDERAPKLPPGVVAAKINATAEIVEAVSPAKKIVTVSPAATIRTESLAPKISFVPTSANPPSDSISVKASVVSPNNPELTRHEKIHEWLVAMQKCRGISRIHTSEKVVALSFDDGPSIKYTPQILKILDKYAVKATFFLIGENVARYPELTQKMFAAEHVLGNHTYTHVHLPQLNADEITDEINKTAAILEKLTGAKPTLFRPPYGTCSDISARVLKEAGYKTIIWSDMANDYDVRHITAAEIAKEIIENATPGAIIALHDAGGDRAKTVAALPKIIATLQNEGYTFVTVPELLNK